MATQTGRPAPPADRSDTLTSARRFGDRLFFGLSTGAGVAVIAIVVAVGVFLLAQALPALMKDQANFLTDRVWSLNGADPEFGIPDLLWVTLISSLIAMVIAVPVAVGVALYLTQYAPARLATPFGYLVDLLAAVPSIVYGVWGIQVLKPYVKPVEQFLASVFGWFPLLAPSDIDGTIFLASVVLAIMVLPIVTAMCREVFDRTPAAHKEGAFALGATRWEMIRMAVLPFGTPGLISAAMLGLGRALGETIAVSLIMGTTATFSWSVFSGGETFASRIANNAAEFDTPTKAGAFISAGLVLFVLTFVVNAIARMVIERRKEFSE